VRSLWLFVCVCAVLFTGCTGTGTKGVPPAPYQASQETWSEKLADSVPVPQWAKPNPQQARRDAEAESYKNDPTSLGYAAGPPNASLYLSMAELSDRGGNTEHARAMYRQALATEPGNLDALLGLARLEDREGNLEIALQVYHQAVSRHPQEPRALNDLSLCLARSGQLDSSLQLLERAVQLRPDKVLYRNNIAKVLLEMNRKQDAIGHLYAVYPPAAAQYNVGIMLNQRGRSAEAVPHLQAALQANPQLEDARHLLAEITETEVEQQQPARQPPNDNRTILANNSHSATGSSFPKHQRTNSQQQYAGYGNQAGNHTVLPTPTSSPTYQRAYPTTSAQGIAAGARPVPGETARVPLGHGPAQLPATR